MQRYILQVVGFIVIFVISINTIHNPFTANYINDMKELSTTVAVNKDPLYEQIVAEAEKYNIKPKNAEIHNVWKATPGYNGIKVDVKKSYEQMKKIGAFNPKLLVFKQVPPSIHLNDLKPAPIYRGHPEKPMVSFIVNVAWGNEYIPEMLDTLKKHHVKATFFLEGRWVKENPELAKMIADAGHEIGNHSYTHPNMAKLPTASVREQLVKTNEVIVATTDVKPALFAPPSGNFRDEIVQIAHEMEMKTIMWSVDTIDWQRPEPHVLVERVMSKIHPGAIVLMHPTSSTAKSLETLIISIKQKKLSIGSVSMLFDEERIIDEPLTDNPS
ncbi:polysaccharide deacetylase family protein [Bacillus sp. FJAT-47783]|uniref:polysaccharide deacetylase family protein n=1 Tax=Bacillus sp. FJAT-47783 TaxID=2922712 RepID=UPI001FACA662|nr:polysaccharide deacetylase family protein [Bacillus sp. FJAT-47783]